METANYSQDKFNSCNIQSIWERINIAAQEGVSRQAISQRGAI